jgi:hypothetical protein
VVSENVNMAARGSSKQEAPRRRPWAWVVAFVAIVAVLVIAGWALGILRLDSLPFASGGSPTTTATPASATPTTTPSSLPAPLPTSERLALNLQIREALFTCGENLVPLSQLTTDPVTFIYAASDAPPTVGRDQAIFDLCDRFLGGSQWVDLTAEQFTTVQNGDYGRWTSNNAVAVHDDAGDVILISVSADNQVDMLLWGLAGTVAY